MPLRTACTSCGKKLQVRDELEGKKVKCPGCQTIFVAASANGDTATGSTAVKAAPTRSAPPVPQTKDKVSAKPMAKKPVPPPPIDDEDDDEDMEEDRPRRKKGKRKESGSLMWVWISSAAAVVVIAVGIALYFLLNRPAPTNPPVAFNAQAPVQAQAPGPQVPTGKVNLADLVPGDAVVFLSVNPGLRNSKVFAGMQNDIRKGEAEFQRQFGFPMADLERVVVFSVGGFEQFQNPQSPPIVVVLQTVKPFDPQQVTASMKKNPNADAAFEIVTDHTLVVGPPAAVQEFKNKKGKTKATGILEQAINQAGSSQGLVAAAIVPPEARQQAGAMLKSAPPEAAAFLNTQAVLASLDLSDRLVVRATLSMADAASAQQAKKSLDEFIKGAPLALGFMLQDQQLVKTAVQTLQSLSVTAKDKDVLIAMQADMPTVMSAVAAIQAKLQGAVASGQEQNNLKQIALAWHNHNDVFKSFPPQTKGKLSWRVAILPFLEQGELYAQFKFDEPWDSPSNKRLLPMMPKIFETSKKAPPGFTYYQTFVGPNTINKDPMKGVLLANIPDGTSNTIIVAEATQPVEWTRPADIQIAPSQPIQLGGANPGFTFAARADGSVARLPRNLDQQILRWLIDPADGKVIPNFEK